MRSLLESIAPAFAPLPVPMTQHLFLERVMKYRHQPEFEVAEQFFRDFKDARDVIYFYMHPFVTIGEATTSFFSEKLRWQDPSKEGVSSTTLTAWRTNNILRDITFGIAEHDSEAAII